MTTSKRALISLSDKSGILDLAKALQANGWEILSTGGTAKYLTENKIKIEEVANVTGFPEIFGGRVKTLHPKIHGGLLCIRNHPEHQAQMAEHGITGIDLLVVNLYPFVETINKPGVSVDEAIENIDIGGPAMLRAAAKNHAFVTVVVDPRTYPELIENINTGKMPDLKRRRELAALTYQHTAQYDSAITQYLQYCDNSAQNTESEKPSTIPNQINLSLSQIQTMRYGENSHQSAGLFVANNERFGFTEASIIQGKAMSFNNFADSNAAFQCLMEFSEPACVIIKHANPCGVAVGKDVLSAYKRAFACDPVSAFGGILAFNREVDAALAVAIGEQFAEVIIAPSFSADALQVFTKKTNLRLLQMPMNFKPRLDVRPIYGGYLVQEPDTIIHEAQLKVVTKKQPSTADLAELKFAFTIAKHVKSNAIIFSKDQQTLGIGAGQMSRVDSTRIAVFKAQDRGFNLQGAYAASDAFFPFRDGLDELAKAGAKAVIQPGGSVRDEEVINAADEHGLIMVFTGIRHFRH